MSQGRPARSDSGSLDWEIDDQFLARLRRASLASRRSLMSGLTGEHPSPRKATAMEFADYRSYSPGDDLRRVDWNAYLRLDHLLIKLADAPERLNLHLLLDGSGSMDWGNPRKFGYAQKLAAGLSYVALSHMDAVNIVMLSEGASNSISRQESARAMPLVVKSIGALQPGGNTNLNLALADFSRQGYHSGVAVLVSDLLSPDGYQAGLERLSSGTLQPVIIHVLSPDEVEPLLDGDLELEDVETGGTIQVSIDWSTKARYRQWLGEWFSEIEAFCSRRGINYIRVETSQAVEELLLGRLHREKVLR